MMHSHHRPKDDPERRAQALSRILDPEYTGHSPNVHSKSFGARSPSLPQASVFVDRYGEQHDPDFRPFGSYPAVTPMDEPSAWPWYDDDDNDEPRSTSHGPTSFRRAHMAHSATSSSYHSSIISSGSGSTSSSAYGSRSRSASALLTPPPEPETKLMSTESHIGRNLSPPAHIPRSALFPWTPAQRAVRVQHEINKRHVLPPPFLEEEPEEVPLTLVDSRYVPGYGHFSSPGPSRPLTAPESQSECKDRQPKRARAHTAPSPTTSQPPEEEEQDEDEQEEQEPVSPSSHHSFRQSVYSFGLRTRLGLHHMKDRIRRASGAAKRPLSL
ncbi:unnamed protein product [Rhizoctonia solani]|uniref:Uncharacterized protein n=1 Tax=Rhizoctonia solani TaxID=456999 RepID=A0A8H3AIT2_9AGAM|nr:unnamed protein product [Rhizoctonia solani]